MGLWDQDQDREQLREHQGHFLHTEKDHGAHNHQVRLSIFSRGVVDEDSGVEQGKGSEEAKCWKKQKAIAGRVAYDRPMA